MKGSSRRRGDRYRLGVAVLGSNGVHFLLDVRVGGMAWVVLDRQATRAAEVFEVLPAGHNHRMVGRKRRRRNGSARR
jgi:hypothetical protein